MPNLIIAGGASDPLALSAASDGALTLQTGPSGAKVNALAFASDGTPTFLRAPVSITGMFTKYFQSTDQTVTGASTLNVAHGLGVTPLLVQVVLKCTTANLNYAVGDELQANFLYWSGQQLINTVANSTNVTIVFEGATLVITDKTLRTPAAATLTSWRWVVRAWA